MYEYNKLKLIGYDSDVENEKQNDDEIEIFCNLKKKLNYSILEPNKIYINFLKNKSPNVNIDNLIYNDKYIYVLYLEHNKYYVGRSNNIFKRIYNHFQKNGAVFTKIFKPIEVLEIINEKDKYDEKNKTIECMIKYGWKNVRGYCWCQYNLKCPPNSIKIHYIKLQKIYIKYIVFILLIKYLYC